MGVVQNTDQDQSQLDRSEPLGIATVAAFPHVSPVQYFATFYTLMLKVYKNFEMKFEREKKSDGEGIS